MKHFLELFILHCLDTKSLMDVTKEDIEQWHMAPRDMDDGRVKYLGKEYESRDLLPDNKINGRSIKELRGRGWDRYGYSLYIKRNGEKVMLTPYDDDQYVDSDEMTWGVAGQNSGSRHIALEGGWGAERDDDFFDHFTDAQFLTLQMYLKEELFKHPQVQVSGHNQFSSKACPGFVVRDLMQQYHLSDYAYEI
jgi:hypothetical protein